MLIDALASGGALPGVQAPRVQAYGTPAAYREPPEQIDEVNEALPRVPMGTMGARVPMGNQRSLSKAMPASWSGAAADAALSRGLSAYQAERAPAAEALAKIVRCGFPYQYDQSFWRAKLFVLGLGMRLILSKSLGKLPILDRLFSQPVAFGVLAGEPYTQVWRRAQRTTAVVWAMAAALLSVVGRRLLTV